MNPLNEHRGHELRREDGWIICETLRPGDLRRVIAHPWHITALLCFGVGSGLSRPVYWNA